MRIPCSEKPGRHERHYRRRLDNPLFGARAAVQDDAALLEAQRLDHEELLAFITELRATVQAVADLEPKVESDVLLGLKETLDRLYEQSAGLADEQAGNQGAILQLLSVMMKNIRQGAAGDPRALDELDQEEQARGMHVALLRHPVIADLLHPDSVVTADDLVPTLLSETPGAALAAVQLFDPAQRRELIAHATALLEAQNPKPATAVAVLEVLLA